jgi:hypothetical protein
MPLVSNILTEQAGPDSLWQDPVPLQDVASEKPWHRLAIMLAAQGCTVTNIARKLDKSVSWVSLLLRQPWARERLVSELMTEGRDELDVLIKGAGPEAFKRIMQMGESAESEAVKFAANKEIVDRHLGKTVVKVEQKVGKLDLDMAAIEAELKVLEVQEKQLLGSRQGTTSSEEKTKDVSEEPDEDKSLNA